MHVATVCSVSRSELLYGFTCMINFKSDVISHMRKQQSMHMHHQKVERVHNIMSPKILFQQNVHLIFTSQQLVNAFNWRRVEFLSMRWFRHITHFCMHTLKHDIFTCWSVLLYFAPVFETTRGSLARTKCLNDISR